MILPVAAVDVPVDRLQYLGTALFMAALGWKVFKWVWRTSSDLQKSEGHMPHLQPPARHRGMRRDIKGSPATYPADQLPGVLVVHEPIRLPCGVCGAVMTVTSLPQRVRCAQCGTEASFSKVEA